MRTWLAILVAAVALALAGPPAQAAPLRVVATVPDLADMAREVGGEEVSVVVLAKGPSDAHFLDAKPSFVKELAQAELFIVVGMELEAGWVPVLLANARNGAVLSGAKGHLDASRAIKPLEVPTGDVDRSQGDIHPYGNPHYLLDPLNGLAVARLIRDKLVALRSEKQSYFDLRLKSFQSRLGEALVGEKLAQKYDVEKLALLFAAGRGLAFLKRQGEEAALGGWIGRLAPHAGAKLVADHNLWPYFTQRFGLAMAGFLEPIPGVTPTTRHLTGLVAKMKADKIRAILAAPYFNERHAQFVSKETGARVLSMAHQVGARSGTDTYLALHAYNVAQVAAALETGR